MLHLHFKISQSVVLMGTTILLSENLTDQQAFFNEMLYNFKSSSTHSYHCLVEVKKAFFLSH